MDYSDYGTDDGDQCHMQRFFKVAIQKVALEVVQVSVEEILISANLIRCLSF